MRKLTYLVFFIFLISCEKDESMSPVIMFQGIFPEIAQEYSDSIVILISYGDSDGDLGENNPNVHNLFVQDNRNDIEYKYRIPELSPSGSVISIQGTFTIKINGTGITDESSSQQVNYDIYVKDRAGNSSNTVSTSSITIEE
ncbi:MAG: hypothetical protein VX762_01170 [Bacteroidota bacterium]|nr:hypothetical protein [Bacteroidota bacterium]MEC9209018.1 hypothetical protein [Bacteroidota bacterium]